MCVYHGNSSPGRTWQFEDLFDAGLGHRRTTPLRNQNEKLDDMKFGETIVQSAYVPWVQPVNQYLEYNALKKLISLIHTSLEMERAGQFVSQDLVTHKLRHSLFQDKWVHLSADSKKRLDMHDDDGDGGGGGDNHTLPLRTSPPSSPTTSSKSLRSPSSTSAESLAKYFAHVLDSELMKISTFVHDKRRQLNKE